MRKRSPIVLTCKSRYKAVKKYMAYVNKKINTPEMLKAIDNIMQPVTISLLAYGLVKINDKIFLLD